MIPDFNEIIASRQRRLKTRLKALSRLAKSKVKPEVIKFRMSEIPKYNAKRRNQVKLTIPAIASLKDKKGTWVYYFIINNPPKKKEEAIRKFLQCKMRNKKLTKDVSKKRSLSYAGHENLESKSRCLYVGSCKRGVQNRIKQHLGHGHIHVGALHLKSWAPPDLKISLYLVEVGDSDLSYEMETGISEAMKPLIGKVDRS